MSIQFPNLGINLDYVGKSIRIFGFEITFFGLLIAAGMLLGLGFIVLEARRCGEKEDDYLEMMILSLVTGVIGARALYVCFSWNLYKGNVNQIFNLRGLRPCFLRRAVRRHAGRSHLLCHPQKGLHADGRYCLYGTGDRADNRKVGGFL